MGIYKAGTENTHDGHALPLFLGFGQSTALGGRFGQKSGTTGGTRAAAIDRDPRLFFAAGWRLCLQNQKALKSGLSGLFHPGSPTPLLRRGNSPQSAHGPVHLSGCAGYFWHAGRSPSHRCRRPLGIRRPNGPFPPGRVV